MSDTTEKVNKELTQLVKDGVQMLNGEANKEPDIKKHYEITELIEVVYEDWYTKCLSVLRQLAPDRVDDFKQLYKIEHRKEIDFSTYTISDYLLGIRLHQNGKYVIGDTQALNIFGTKLRVQIGIMNSLLGNLKSTLSNIQGILQAEIFDNELDVAEELLKNGYFRPAGVLAGVSLEAHLQSVCNNHKVSITAKNPTISTYNDAMKSVVYDVSQWRFIQLMADLRNKCAHKGTAEPTNQDVQDLIDGVKKVIKTVF